MWVILVSIMFSHALLKLLFDQFSKTYKPKTAKIISWLSVSLYHVLHLLLLL